MLRHHPGRQKAALPWDTLHYPHHPWQSEPSSGQAAAVRPGTHSSSLCQHTGLCLACHHARRASEPQHLLHSHSARKGAHCSTDTAMGRDRTEQSHGCMGQQPQEAEVPALISSQQQNQMPLCNPKQGKAALISKLVFQSRKSVRLQGLPGVRLGRKIPFWFQPGT